MLPELDLALDLALDHQILVPTQLALDNNRLAEGRGTGGLKRSSSVHS
jgi:hypothetical protein